MPRSSEVGAPTSSGALRNLVGAGPSQVGIVGALRARDVSRPTEADSRNALAKPAPSARFAPQQAAGAGDSAAKRHETTGGTPVSS